MAAEFHIHIITPDKDIYEGQIQSLVAPAALGYTGILANHAPYVTTLSPGKITFRDIAGKTSTFDSKGSGYLEVSDNKAVLLVDSAEPRS